MPTTIGSEVTLTDTTLDSLTSSATAGWTSDAIDTSDCDDVEFTISIDPANTAPANSKGWYIFLGTSNNTSNYPTTGAASGGTTGTQGALTFPDVTTTPNNLTQVEFLNYQNADVVQSRSFSMLAKGIRPQHRTIIAVVNHTGATNSSSTVTYRKITYP